MTIASVLAGAKIVPVLTIRDANTAADLARALDDGGLHTIEVTLRTAEAEAAIEKIRSALPDMVVGAGSVMNPHDARRSVAAGATFLVSPGFSLDTVAEATHLGVPHIPGVATATEVQTAWNAGVGVVKVFPAEQIGGAPLVNSFASVWPDLQFMPTGGINHSNAADYLRLRSVLAVGGSWMATTVDIEQMNWPGITAAASAAVSLWTDTRE